MKPQPSAAPDTVPDGTAPARGVEPVDDEHGLAGTVRVELEQPQNQLHLPT